MSRPFDDFQARFRAAVDADWLASTLAQWMTTHRAEMGDLLSSGDVNWAEAASLFGQAGLIDARGRPPNAETAAETWRRVRLSNPPAPSAPASD